MNKLGVFDRLSLFCIYAFIIVFKIHNLFCRRPVGPTSGLTPLAFFSYNLFPDYRTPRYISGAYSFVVSNFDIDIYFP